MGLVPGCANADQRRATIERKKIVLSFLASWVFYSQVVLSKILFIKQIFFAVVLYAWRRRLSALAHVVGERTAAHRTAAHRWFPEVQAYRR